MEMLETVSESVFIGEAANFFFTLFLGGCCFVLGFLEGRERAVFCCCFVYGFFCLFGFFWVLELFFGCIFLFCFVSSLMKKLQNGRTHILNSNVFSRNYLKCNQFLPSPGVPCS